MRWRDAHILQRLSDHRNLDSLLVVDRPVSLAERVLRRTPASVKGAVLERRRFGRVRAVITQVAARTFVLDTAVNDVLGPARDPYVWWFAVFSRRDILDAVMWASERIVGAHPATLAWTPTVYPAVRAIRPSSALYDSLDNWLLHPMLKRYADLAASSYATALPKMTAVVASAPRSREVLLQWASDVHVIPNGVDPRPFSQAWPRPPDLPAPPVVGYAGSLGPRVDTRLVASVASALPRVQFVFIGQELGGSGRKTLTRLPNVHLLGDRHYRLVPAYVTNFDIAWIPHALGASESGGDPIKLYEYLAANRQVLATRIDGLDAWERSVHLVDSPDQATEAIAGLLSGTLSPKTTDLPPERTWEHITDQIISLLGSGH